jgi:hypothetical protein
LYNGLEGLDKDAIQLGVLETALSGLCEGCAERECDYDIVGVLGGATALLLALSSQVPRDETVRPSRRGANSHGGQRAG